MEKELKHYSIENYFDMLKWYGLEPHLTGNWPKKLGRDKVLQISFDSREVQEGCLFICKGKNFDAEYLKAAFEKGAVCYVSESPRDKELPGIIVSRIRRAMPLISNKFYHDPWMNYPLIGLTGSKGKSSTLYFLKSIAESYNKKFAYISTIDTYDGIEQFESHLTTPEALTLGHLFYNAQRAGVWALGMEVSSQGLKYGRTDGIEFDIAAFLNFGTDHIGEGEHRDEDDYFFSKLRIFGQCKKAVINADTDRYYQVMLAARAGKHCNKIITYSAKGEGADYVALDIHKEGAETVFVVMGQGANGELRLTMPGLFNVDNALAAAVIALQMGVPFDIIREGLYKASVPGRMEIAENRERELVCFVDYAHSKLSFEKLFDSVKKEYPGYRLEALFGCPGGKGLQRRTDLPEIASRYCDYVYITEEDPAEDDPLEISKIVLANLISAGGKGEIIVDREEAIKKAIVSAPPKTVLCVLAKGREGYMHRGSEYIPIESDWSIVNRLIV